MFNVKHLAREKIMEDKTTWLEALKDEDIQKTSPTTFSGTARKKPSTQSMKIRPLRAAELVTQGKIEKPYAPQLRSAIPRIKIASTRKNTAAPSQTPREMSLSVRSWNTCLTSNSPSTECAKWMRRLPKPKP